MGLLRFLKINRFKDVKKVSYFSQEYTHATDPKTGTSLLFKNSSSPADHIKKIQDSRENFISSGTYEKEK